MASTANDGVHQKMDVIETTRFLGHQNVRSRTKFLSTSIGEPLSYFVKFSHGSLAVFTVEGRRVSNTNIDGNIVDVDYFPSEDGNFGLVVAIHNAGNRRENTVNVYKQVDNGNIASLELSMSADVPHKVTTLKTLLSSEDMGSMDNTQLNRVIRSWKNIVAIGTKHCHCYVTTFDTSEEKRGAEDDMVKDIPLIDVLGGIVKNGVMSYVLQHEYVKKVPAVGVYVTALCFMPRSRTLVIGTSMGGIVTAAMNKSNKIGMELLINEQSVRYLAPMEPEDDPDRNEWFLAAFDANSSHRISFALYEGIFRNPNEEAPKPEEKFDKPVYFAKMGYEFADGERWLSMRTLVHERVEHARRMSRLDESNTSLNASLAHGSNRNRSLAAFTYSRKTQAGSMIAGGIFDLNMYYYKRFPASVLSDRTILKQCPFLSTIRTKYSSSGVEDIGFLMTANDMKLFSSSICAEDQLFYPSSLSFGDVFAVTTNSIVSMRVSSLQSQVLSKIGNNLSEVMSSPSSAANLIRAAGLVNAQAFAQESPIPSQNAWSIDERIILTTLLHYEVIGERSKMLTLLGTEHELDVANWAWREASDIRLTVNDRISPLFEGSATSLSPQGAQSLYHGIRMFTLIEQLLLACRSTNARVSAYASAVHCMREHTELVSQFIKYNIVPLSDVVNKRIAKLHAARVEDAKKRGTTDELNEILTSLHKKTKNNDIWNNKPIDAWYPPRVVNLLEPLLMPDVPERLKRDLIIAFLCDWAQAVDTHKEWTDVELARRVLTIFGIYKGLGVNADKVLFSVEKLRNHNQPATNGSGGYEVFCSMEKQDFNAKPVRQKKPVNVDSAKTALIVDLLKRDQKPSVISTAGIFSFVPAGPSLTDSQKTNKFDKEKEDRVSTKRRSTNVEQDNEPAAKRNALRKDTIDENVCEHAAEVYAAIRTPARQLRYKPPRPDEFSPPSGGNIPPSVCRAPTSILKTAKPDASPSRARNIRFAELPPIKPLTFDILPDEEEETIQPKSVVVPENVEDECIEQESTFEVQEDQDDKQKASNTLDIDMEGIKPAETTYEVYEDEPDENLKKTFDISSDASVQEIEPDNKASEPMETSDEQLDTDKDVPAVVAEEQGGLAIVNEVQEDVAEEEEPEKQEDEQKEVIVSAEVDESDKNEEEQMEVDGESDSGDKEAEIEVVEEKEDREVTEEKQEDVEEDVVQIGDEVGEEVGDEQKHEGRVISTLLSTKTVDNDGVERSFEMQADDELANVQEARNLFSSVESEVKVQEDAEPSVGTPSRSSRRLRAASTARKTESVVVDDKPRTPRRTQRKTSVSTENSEAIPEVKTSRSAKRNLEIEASNLKEKTDPSEVPVENKRTPGRPRSTRTLTETPKRSTTRTRTASTMSTKTPSLEEVNTPRTRRSRAASETPKSVVEVPTSTRRRTTRANSESEKPAKKTFDWKAVFDKNMGKIEEEVETNKANGNKKVEEVPKTPRRRTASTTSETTTPKKPRTREATTPRRTATKLATVSEDHETELRRSTRKTKKN